MIPLQPFISGVMESLVRAQDRGGQKTKEPRSAEAAPVVFLFPWRGKDCSVLAAVQKHENELS